MLISVLLLASLALNPPYEEPFVFAVHRGSVDPIFYDYYGFLASPETLLVVLPFEDSKLLGAGIRRIGYLPDQGLWIVKRDKDSLEIASETIFLETKDAFFISPSESLLNDLRRKGLFIIPVEFIPISRILAPPFGEVLVERFSAQTTVVNRWQRAREIANSVDSLEVKANLNFLCRDPNTREASARYSCRDELREIYAPFIKEKFEQYLAPRGGSVDTMMFRIGACGQKHLINIVASKPGLLTSAHYLICAHYDAIASHDHGWRWEVDPSPGADDNASGVAALLECVRILGSIDLDVGVKFVAFSGEEQGLTGSLDYVRRLSESDSIIGVINFDMIGWVGAGKAAVVNYDWKSGWLAKLLKEAKDSLAITEFNLRLRESGITAVSDHSSFWMYGIPGVWLNEDASYPYYHSMADTAGNVDIAQVCDIVKLTSGLLGFFISQEVEGRFDIVLDQDNVQLDWQGKLSGRQIWVGDIITATVRAVNRGPAMETEERYLFEIWDGARGKGRLIKRDTIDIQLASGMTTEIRHSWEVNGSIGKRILTFVLLPLDQDIEEDLSNNVASVDLIVASEKGLLLTDLRVFPNPATDGSSIKVGFVLLYPGTSLFARLEISIYDLTGGLLVKRILERTGIKKDFEIGENTIDLGDVLRIRDLSPGIYYLVASVIPSGVGESSRASEARTIFAVAR